MNWFLKQKRVFCHLSIETKGFSHPWKYVQQVIQLSRYSSYQTFLKFSSKMNFSDILKYADITPVLKKDDTTEKSNCKPISTLSNFSEVFY